MTTYLPEDRYVVKAEMNVDVNEAMKTKENMGIEERSPAAHAFHITQLVIVRCRASVRCN